MGFAGAMALAAVLSYLVPAFAQDKSSSNFLLAEYSEPFTLSGPGRVDETRTYNGSLGAASPAGTHDVVFSFAFRIEASAPGAPALRISIESLFAGLWTKTHELTYQVGGSSTYSREIASPPYRVHCPCVGKETAFRLSVSVDSESAYSYEFNPLNLGAEASPIDSDGDGIVDNDQWLHGVPQYFISAGFLALSLAAIAAALYLRRRKTARG